MSNHGEVKFIWLKRDLLRNSFTRRRRLRFAQKVRDRLQIRFQGCRPLSQTRAALGGDLEQPFGMSFLRRFPVRGHQSTGLHLFEKPIDARQVGLFFTVIFLTVTGQGVQPFGQAVSMNGSRGQCGQHCGLDQLVEGRAETGAIGQFRHSTKSISGESPMVNKLAVLPQFTQLSSVSMGLCTLARRD